MKKSRANKGQFSIIAALLVSVILVTAVISTYTMVRNAPLQDSPQVLTAIGEMNKDIKTILDFTVGYYDSILRVTGNATYAKGLITSYLSSGLVNIARSHPEWNPSFTLTSQDVSTRWFMPESYSVGNISVTYSLSALGIEGVKYVTSSALEVTMLESNLGVARIRVTRDNNEPELGLSKENFGFYKYNYVDSTWTLVNPTDIIISSNGVYSITLPSGIDQNAYFVQIEDRRGLVVTSFYSQDSVASAMGIPQYTYTFDWDATGMLDIYEDLSTDTFAIELLQNGTMNWLGQPLDLAPQERAIPPISVKALRVNATTTGGVNQEIPFQVEDWASDYKIPLGLAGKEGLFNNNNMLVFLVNNEISEVTLWWDGNDVATQTSYAWENIYFNDNPSSGTLENGFLHLDVNNFYVRSNVLGEYADYRTDFLRVSDDMPDYGADPAYVIYNGVVRDIVQQEPEFGGGGVSGSPNFYSQVFLTLPANVPYYTYAVRTIFVDSLQPRTVDDLSIIQISDLSGTPLTEDGTSGGYPETSTSTGLFYDSSPTGWDHHWSQVSAGNSGAGVMFTDNDNQNLYTFDTSDKRGALNVHSNVIEVNPVDSALSSISFTTSRDLTWYGAVVTFDGEPVHPTSGHTGLWVMVEQPPTVSMDEYEEVSPPPPEGSVISDYVDEMSDEDLSPDKGSHSEFPAQQEGPDSIFDTLTEITTESGGIEDYVDNDASNVDSSSDLGNLINFNNMKATDSTYATLTESGSGGGITFVNVAEASATSGTSATISKPAGTQQNDFMIALLTSTIGGDGDGASMSVAPSGWTLESEYTQNTYSGQHVYVYWKVADASEPSSYSWTWAQSCGWVAQITTFNGVDTSSPIHIEGTVNQESSGSPMSPSVTTTENNCMVWLYDMCDGTVIPFGGGEPSGTSSIEQTEVSNPGNGVGISTAYFVQATAGATGDKDWNLDSFDENSGQQFALKPASSDYRLDQEVQWTDIPSSLPNEYLSIYGGTMGAEDVAVDVWTPSGWENVFTDLSSGWNNVSISDWLTDSDFTIRFRDGTTVGDASADTWQIDVALIHVWSEDENYEIDLEVQWTNVDYDETNEELCIYVGSVSGENLRVDVWTGSAWETVFSALNIGWNNVTVSSYLTSSTFTIRFIGETETGDTTQDYWTIDATLIRSWT